MALRFALTLLILSFPPSKYDVLRTFCGGWLISEPVYRFPLDELTVGRPIYYYPWLTMENKQKIWQMRKKHQLSGVPFDINRDGICNFKDYAILANWFKENK